MKTGRKWQICATASSVTDHSSFGSDVGSWDMSGNAARCEPARYEPCLHEHARPPVEHETGHTVISQACSVGAKLGLVAAGRASDGG